jgi:hypothetical protein
MSKLKAPAATKRSGFRTGTTGACEAILYEFHDGEDTVSEDPKEPAAAEHPTGNVVRIAAVTLEEALQYLRFSDPGFNVDTVIKRGLIAMVSGSPLE